MIGFSAAKIGNAARLGRVGRVGEEFAAFGKAENIANISSISGKELFNFSSKAAEHMANPSRSVPIHILQDAIKSTKGVPDPRGSRASMYYTEMWKNGQKYNLEILYDKPSNSIWHFQYDRKARGNIPKINK